MPGAIKIADGDSMNSSVAGWHVNKRAVRVQAARLKPDDHSELVPLLPIPNRTVKRLSADDSADSRVKVGHRQATYSDKSPCSAGAFASLRVQHDAATRCDLLLL